MEWGTLLSKQRMRGSFKSKKNTDLRSEFEKDYHRIIGSASFRRLQDKTQVFPLDQSDFVRTRLTHSLEVSSLAKSLGQNIGENILKDGGGFGFTPRMKEDISHILECAGLIHDIGNPPFGHFGEEAIRDWFRRNLPYLKFIGYSVEELLTEQMREDFYHFEGNAQALRLVTRLHYLVDEYGMNLTYALLNTIVKYPVKSIEIQPQSGDIREKKMGYYFAEEEIFQEISKATGTGNKRHPLTFILEAADDLAYTTADIEDGFVKGLISYHKLKEELESLQRNTLMDEFFPADRLEMFYNRGIEKEAHNLESYAVKNWIVWAQSYLIHCATTGFTKHYQEIMNGTFKKDIFSETVGEKFMTCLGSIAHQCVFTSKDIYRREVTESVMIDFLMDRLVSAVLYYDTEFEQDTMQSRMISIISDNYKKAYRLQSKGKSEAEKLYLRLLLVTDYICGMTDSYAKRLYQEMNGII